jgi:hypothetical protein
LFSQRPDVRGLDPSVVERLEGGRSEQFLEGRVVDAERGRPGADHRSS